MVRASTATLLFLIDEVFGLCPCTVVPRAFSWNWKFEPFFLNSFKQLDVEKYIPTTTHSWLAPAVYPTRLQASGARI